MNINHLSQYLYNDLCYRYGEVSFAEVKKMSHEDLIIELYQKQKKLSQLRRKEAR